MPLSQNPQKWQSPGTGTDVIVLQPNSTSNPLLCVFGTDWNQKRGEGRKSRRNVGLYCTYHEKAPQWKALLSFEELEGLEGCRQLPLLLGLGKFIRPENCQIYSEGKGEGSCKVWRKFNPFFFFFNLQIVKNWPELPIVKFCLIIKLGAADPARRYSDEVLGLGSFHWQRSSGTQTGF